MYVIIVFLILGIFVGILWLAVVWSHYNFYRRIIDGEISNTQEGDE